jgi:hypothetical protein
MVLCIGCREQQFRRWSSDIFAGIQAATVRDLLAVNARVDSHRASALMSLRRNGIEMS